MADAMKRFRANRRVEFRDTDAAGIMHFSTFFTYMEEVEHEFLRSLGRSVMPTSHEDDVSWPRVAANCNYASPLRFEQEFEVSMCVSRIGSSSVAYSFRFEAGEKVFATGELTAVCCQIQENGPLKKCSIPDDFRSLLLPYVCSDPLDAEQG